MGQRDVDIFMSREGRHLSYLKKGKKSTKTWGLMCVKKSEKNKEVIKLIEQ